MAKRHLIGYTGLVACFGLLIAINAISQPTLRGARIDLTENRLYTLTPGTRNILANLEEPITLRFFYSERAFSRIPFLRAYGDFVRELLENYAANSNGRITLEIIDPIAFSEAEDQAIEAGIMGLPISAGEVAYLGLEAVNSIGEREVIPNFNPDGQEFLEYELSSLIVNLSTVERRRIVVMTALEIEGTRPDAMARLRGDQEVPPWTIFSALQRLYDVEVHNYTITQLPEGDIDLLILIHPRRFQPELEYSIDQFVMNGGRVLLFVDPLGESDTSNNIMGNPLQSLVMPRNSTMPKLLQTFGLDFDASEIILDRRNSLPIQVMDTGRPELVNFVAYFALGSDEINNDDMITARMERIQLGTAGRFTQRDDATARITPLLQSSPDAMTVSVDRLQLVSIDQRVVRELLRDFEPLDEPQLVAARIEGPVNSAFGDQAPDFVGVDPAAHRSRSVGDINAVVVADTDMLTDRFWIQRTFFGLNPVANNGDFFINAVDVLSGSDDLISIRARGRFDRNFKVVEEKLRDARERFAERQREIQGRLDTITAELEQLLEAGDSAAIFTPEVQERIVALRSEQAEQRRALRQTNLQLQQDVERLQRNIRLINIALIPALVGLIALVIGGVRIANRRRRK